MPETATALKPTENWRSKWKLSHNQARFVRLVWGSKPATLAYIVAYQWGDVTTNSKRYAAAAVCASKLLKTAKVKAALNALQEREASIAGLARETKRGVLAAVAMGEVEGTNVADRIRAILADNLMTGDNKPIKIEGELTFQAMLDSLPAEILPGAYAGNQPKQEPETK